MVTVSVTTLSSSTKLMAGWLAWLAVAVFAMTFSSPRLIKISSLDSCLAATAFVLTVMLMSALYSSIFLNGIFIRDKNS